MTATESAADQAADNQAADQHLFWGESWFSQYEGQKYTSESYADVGDLALPDASGGGRRGLA